MSGEAMNHDHRPAKARRMVLNALLAAWDAYPTRSLGELLALAAQRGNGKAVEYRSDTEMLVALRLLVEEAPPRPKDEPETPLELRS